MPEPVIKVEGLTKYYGKSMGVEDLTFSVEEGEIFGYLGPNGAGKTTTIRTLLSLMHPTRGSAAIFGKDAHTDSEEIRKHIGYLPGELSMYLHLTGMQVIEYLGNLRGGVDWDTVNHLARRLDFDMSRKIKSLSSGNKRKAGLIQALMHKPKLLVLDEPTSGLDPLMQQVFYEMVDEARKNGQTVFVSSHNLPEVERICDRAGFIRQGKLVSVESVAEVKAKVFQIVEIEFAANVDKGVFEQIEGISELAVEDNKLTCQLSGTADQLIKAAARFEVVKFMTHDPHLEDIFMTYYEGDNHVQ